ncbi:HAD family hydrolase [Candidatus Woesearchaeota archaeon]|nr:HAD family hydrolase [Candidatus Woesearchaeota archaeon]
MKAYLLDLEGTTGIYSSRQHVNDMIVTRPGLRDAVRRIHENDGKAIITTRAPRPFVEEALAELKRLTGIEFDGLYTKQNIQLESDIPITISYKDYRKVCEEHGISDPSQAVVIGDFLRFSLFKDFSAEEYRNFSFSQNPSKLTSNCALNDHPLPAEDSPVYAVVPQMWSTCNADGEIVTLNMDYIVRVLEAAYAAGGNDFLRGLNKIEESPDEVVATAGLSERIADQLKNGQKIRDPQGEDITALFRVPKTQRYLIFKGHETDWYPTERIK